MIAIILYNPNMVYESDVCRLIGDVLEVRAACARVTSSSGARVRFAFTFVHVTQGSRAFVAAVDNS